MTTSKSSVLTIPTPVTLFRGHFKIRYAAQKLVHYLGLYYNFRCSFTWGLW